MHISESRLTYQIVVDIEKLLLLRAQSNAEKLNIYQITSQLKDMCYQRDYESFNTAA